MSETNHPSHSTWEFPKLLVRHVENGKEYKIVSATPTHYCLECVEDSSVKVAVDKDDPHNRYVTLGYYE